MIWRILNILVIAILLPVAIIEFVLIPIPMYIITGNIYFNRNPYIIELASILKEKSKK